MVARSSRPRTLTRDQQPSTSTTIKARDARIAKRSNDATSTRSSLHRAVSKAASNDVSMKDARRPTAPRSGAPIELKVTGWQKNKASGEKDGGVSSLIKWLERKASTKLSSRARTVRIRKSKVDGTDIIISVSKEDAPALLRLDNYVWAGVNVKLQRLDGSSTSRPDDAASNKNEVADMLRGVLERRYNAETKLLDLSALGQDEELRNAKVFDTRATTNKFFAAMMALLDRCFDSTADKDAAITSVSLANNDLNTLTQVSSLSMTLPKLLNLDLSNNKFEKLADLSLWRRRFYHLQHIILAGNAVETNEPEFHKELLKWYPNLRLIDTVQVRSEEEIANSKKFRHPPRPPVFNDQDGICQGFIRNLVAGFDNDRPGLAAFYYDDKSQFSYSVNTSAPRDKDTPQAERQDWAQYINGSRNLKRIAHLPVREKRLARGTKDITEAFVALPKTKHPDLDAESQKYVIEAQIIPRVPDPTGASSTGVDGFIVTMHGEYDEVETGKKRSFDRTIILGPGGQSGVRVVSDLLLIRAYGGSRAFDPTRFTVSNKQQQQIPAAPAPAPAQRETTPPLPAGLTIAVAEQMVMELSNQTKLTVEMAKDCLANAEWNMEKAMGLFAQVQATLPPTAFVQGA